MKRALTAGVVGLVLILSPLVARAQPLADRLPASTMLYVGWTPTAALQNTSAAKMLADERVMGPWRTLFKEVLASLPEMPHGEGISEHIPALLSEAMQCEGCFALLELKQGKRGSFNPQSVLMIDLGARRKSFENHFKPIHAKLRERLGERVQMMKLDKSWVWFRPDRDGRPKLTWGFVGDVFVMFFGDAAEGFIPKLVKGPAENPLKTATPFVETVGKLQGESVFTTYLDVKSSLTLLRRVLEREGDLDLRVFVMNWEKVLEELGVGNVKGMGEKTTIEDRQFLTRTLIRTEGAPRGLLGLLAQPAVDQGFLKAVPADAMAAAAWRMDLAKVYEQIKASMIRIGGDDAVQGFNQLEQGAQGMGLPVRDVLAALGDQWAIYNAQSQGGFVLSGWTLVVNIRDAQKFARSFEVIRNLLPRMLGGGDVEGGGARIRQIDADGTRVEYVQMGRWGGPFAPAWAVLDDKLIIALFPQHVEDAIAHIKNGGKSILDNPDFVSARNRTGDEGPVLYLSGPQITTNLYPFGLFLVSVINSFGGFGDGDDGPTAGADLLPSLQRLLLYVGHDALSIKATPDGLLKTRTVANPLLSPLAWFDSPVVVMAILIPTIGQMEDAADQNQSAMHLRQIGQAMMMHANENKGAFPADFQALTRTQDLSPEVLRSPFGPAKNGPDFVYLHFKGLSNAAGPEVVVAYDAAALEQGEGTNVLLGDGSVRWVDAGEFPKVLEESKKKAAAGKNQEP